jgi:hypothetical protein
MPIIPVDEPAAGAWRAAFDFSSRRAFFDDTAVAYLQAVSRVLLRDTNARQYPDLIAFAYFCRRANLHALVQRYPDAAQRSGWGTVVHVAPSNIPINFAFSLVFGLLAGNSNIVRMPSRQIPQNDLLIALFDQVAAAPEFKSITSGTMLVRTERDSDGLRALVAAADGLVVWGGDATVGAFRALPKQPRCIEIYFPDRKSSAVVDAAAYLALSQSAMQRLAHDFYNDTYLVDQNACSSPSIVFWIGAANAVSAAKDAFWYALDDELKWRDYRLDPTARIEKCLDLMTATLEVGRAVHLQQYSPDIWCLEEQSPLGRTPLRFGQFVDVDLPTIGGIAAHLRPQEQTLTFFGIAPRELLRVLTEAHGHVVDRIVPIGKALDINPFWDGKDVLALLSRRIDLLESTRDALDGGRSAQAPVQA